MDAVLVSTCQPNLPENLAISSFSLLDYCLIYYLVKIHISFQLSMMQMFLNDEKGSLVSHLFLRFECLLWS
jgi:hypothetical protein